MMILRAPVGTSCDTIGQDRASQSAMTMLLPTPLDKKKSAMAGYGYRVRWTVQVQLPAAPWETHFQTHAVLEKFKCLCKGGVPSFLVEDRIQKGPDQTVASLG